MGVVSTAELVLAALTAESASDTGTETVASVAQTVSAESKQLSSQVAVAVAIESLVEDGLVVRETGERGTEQLSLSTEGELRGGEIFNQIAETEIEIVDGDRRRSLPIKNAAPGLELSIPELAARCTDEGVYYRRETPPDGLVDRNTEREQFEQLIDRCRSRQRGELLVISGPGGIGKTALSTELLSGLPESVDSLQVTCQPSETEPYGPVREMLSALGRTDPFASTGPALEDTSDVEAQQTALFHDVTEALRPDTDDIRVLCLDDVGLADTATWSYLAYLLERLSELPLVVVLTHRPGTLPDETVIGDSTVETEIPSTELELDTLSRSETRQLVEQVTGTRGAPGEFITAVQTRTDGIPLFVESTVDTLLENGQLDPNYRWYPDSTDEIELATEVHETVRRQIRTLDSLGQTVLEWVAVAGEPISTGVLTAVCEHSEQQIQTTVDILIRAEFLERQERTGEVSIRSNVVREAIIDTMTASRRQACHGALAESLGETATDGTAQTDRAATIAFHYTQAGDDAAAIEWYRTAGIRAADVYAHETAVEQYENALQLARNGEEQRLSIGEQLATLHLATGEYEQADRYVRYVRERTDEQDSQRRQRLAYLSARVAHSRGSFAEALEAIRNGLAHSEEPTSTRCKLLGKKVEIETHLGEYETASDTLKRQRALADELDSQEARVRVTRQRGMLADQQSDYTGARKQYRTALSIVEDDPHEKAKIQNALGLTARKQGEFSQAEQFHRNALDQCREVGDRHMIGTLHNNLGLVAWRQGEYEQAADSLKQAIATAREMQDSYLEALGTLNLGNVHRELGEFERARQSYEDAIEVFEETDHEHLVAITHHDMGKLARRRGAFDQARTHCETALDIYESVDHRHHIGAVRDILGRIATDTGEFERARAAFEQALDIAREIENESLSGKVKTGMAQLALLTDSPDTADERLSDALTEFEAVDNRHGLARARLHKGRVIAARGDTDAAREQIQTAIEQFQAIGASYHEAIARYWLGRLIDEQCSPATEAIDQWKTAFEQFSEIGAVEWGVETATLLVQRTETDTDDWCNRALTLTADSSVPVSEQRVAWFRDRIAPQSQTERIARSKRL